MSRLKAVTRLQRIAELDLHLNADGTVRLKWDGKHLHAGTHTLTILETFRESLALGEGVERLRSTGMVDWVSLTSAIKQLFDAGILQDVDAIEATPIVAAGFGNPRIHIAMLNDHARTASYLKAIQEVVHPGDIVVDIGTGTGVLALAAAVAGAAHVYAIEANQAIAQVAQATFHQNGVADKITLLHGWSTQVELPVQADVLVSEVIGNDPLDENISAIISDAIKRLLKTNARLVPERLALFGLPVTVPAHEWSQCVVLPETVANWKRWYELDLSPLAEMRRSMTKPLFTTKPQKARGWNRLSDPLLLADIDLKQLHSQRIDTNQSATVHSAGRLNGLLVYFEARLSPHITLSTHPDMAHDCNHWRSPVWGLFPPCNVSAGDDFTVQYQDNRNGNTCVHLSVAGLPT